MSSSYVIIHKNKEGKLEKSSSMTQKEANHYCVCLEVIHGVGTHLVIEEENLQNVNLEQLLAIN